MPASLFTDMERNSRALEDHRVLELALEMSMFGFNNENESLGNSYDGEPRSKKSQNTTECVPVPSSEHVAEIVGRQGCKIKALRAKTNTYIKTPVRGEEPVFVVTGRKEDVCAAKREILSAADHFSQIRAQRKGNLNGGLAPGPNSNIPGQTTIHVRVPYRVVGLVVGPKGATIKRIQQQTNTYIVTPSRDKEPIFEVTGLPESVEGARKEIEAHIAMRTGGALDDEELANNINALPFSAFPSVDYQRCGSKQTNDAFSAFFGNYPFTGLYDVDEGLGDSPTFESTNTSSWPEYNVADSALSLFGSSTPSLSERSNSLSGVLSDLIIGGDPHPPARRIHSDPLAVPEVGDILGSLGDTITSNSLSPLVDSIVEDTNIPKKVKKECVICFESAIIAALVPCGHNLFCLECANRICEKSDGKCPCCGQPASQAIRIYT